jgi:hypothetical protein
MLVNRLWPWQWHTATREAAQVVAVNPSARNPVNHGRTGPFMHRHNRGSLTFRGFRTWEPRTSRCRQPNLCAGLSPDSATNPQFS